MDGDVKDRSSLFAKQMNQIKKIKLLMIKKSIKDISYQHQSLAVAKEFSLPTGFTREFKICTIPKIISFG